MAFTAALACLGGMVRTETTLSVHADRNAGETDNSFFVQALSRARSARAGSSVPARIAKTVEEGAAPPVGSLFFTRCARSGLEHGASARPLATLPAPRRRPKLSLCRVGAGGGFVQRAVGSGRLGAADG